MKKITSKNIFTSKKTICNNFTSQDFKTIMKIMDYFVMKKQKLIHNHGLSLLISCLINSHDRGPILGILSDGDDFFPQTHLFVINY